MQENKTLFWTAIGIVSAGALLWYLSGDTN